MKKAEKVALALFGAALVLEIASCSNASGGGGNATAMPTSQPESGGSGGGSQQQTPATYTVTFDTDGGSAVTSQTVTAGQKAARPAAEPTKSGDKTSYVFLGWYKSDLSAPFDFDSAINETTTIKAKWLEGFVKVEGANFDGSQAITGSNVFIAGKSYTIPTLYVSDHEVTQGEYEKYCGYDEENTNKNYGDGEDFPAYNVFWLGAVVYCNLRSIAEHLTPVYSVPSATNPTDPRKWENMGISCDQSNKLFAYNCFDISGTISVDLNANGYRLPTVAEWEYLARGGNLTNSNQTKFSGSDTVGDVAWYKDNSGGKAHKVKTKDPNGLKLYDMSGNVWEWCYSSITASGEGLCGGGYSAYHSSGCLIVDRYPQYQPEAGGDFDIGFRVVRNAN